LLSGIVAEYVEPLRERFAPNFEERGHLTLDMWNALLFERK